MKSTIYRGFQIDPVFNYSNGKSDVQYYRISDPEDCGIALSITLPQMKMVIDERLEERPELYEVQPAEGRRGLRSELPLLEALSLCHFWNGQLLADFRTM